MTPETYVEQLCIDLDLPEKVDRLLVDQFRKQASQSFFPLSSKTNTNMLDIHA